MTAAGPPDEAVPAGALAAADPPDESAGEAHSPARFQFMAVNRPADSTGDAAPAAPAGVDLYENNAWFADASVAFMILKAWEYRADARFAARWPLVKSQGRFRGAYLFGHPGVSATAQAGSFVTVLKDSGFTAADTAWLDFEVSDGRSPSYCAGWAAECCAAIDAGLGLPGGSTGVYTFRDFIWQGCCSGLGSRPLWIAVPAVLGQVPAMNLGPWAAPALVQYQVTSIDWDFFAGTAAELAVFWGAAGQPPQPPPAAPPFPYPPGDYLALPAKDPHCHSGYYAADQPHVRTWQAQMAARGWPVPVSGHFDAACDRACRAFQAQKGLTADGKVGPVTWGKAWTAPVT